MHLAQLLIRQARARPGRTAIFHGATPWASWGEWAARSAGLVTRLRRAGIRKGDRILLCARNHPRYLEVMWAAWWAGIIVVPVNARLHPEEIAWIGAHAGARWAFVDADLLPGPLPGVERQVDLDSAEADRLLAPVESPLAVPVARSRPDDVAWLFYTSGTTGRPKGVMLTQRNLMTMGLAYFSDVDAISARDAMAYAAPMSHGCGLYAIPHVMAGARHVVPTSRGVDPAELFALSRALGPLTTFAAPTIIRRLVAYMGSRDLAPAEAARTFKTIVYGGAPMHLEDLREALAMMGPRFVQIYGQGESPMVITALARGIIADIDHPRWAERAASAGIAQTPVEVRIAGPNGHSLPTGETGEVLVRGDTVMQGYWEDPPATRRALRKGWLWTGDLGALDGEGFLTLKDRSKDLIISGGSNIYPREVEAVLRQAPGVADVAVVGAPDPEWGEIVVAFVVSRSEGMLDRRNLDAHCLAHLARFKRPRRYVFVDALPRNSTGKLLKTALRARLSTDAPA